MGKFDNIDLGNSKTQTRLIEAHNKIRKEAMEGVHKYVTSAIRSFTNDPAATDFQRGYLTALQNVLQELEQQKDDDNGLTS